MSVFAEALSSHEFNAILHIDDTPAYDQHDLEIVAALGQIIADDGAIGRIGVCLIHKHYDLIDGELVVERSTGGDFGFSVSCEKPGRSDLVPSMIKFRPDSSTAQILQWSRQEPGHARFGFTADDEPLLTRLRETILGEDCENRFGIMLLHRVASLPPGKILMEMTDEPGRLQVMSLANPPMSGEPAIGTQWMFRQDGPSLAMACATFCHYDNGHRQRHSSTGHPT